jgi:hypothetical protein
MTCRDRPAPAAHTLAAVTPVRCGLRITADANYRGPERFSQTAPDRIRHGRGTRTRTGEESGAGRPRAARAAAAVTAVSLARREGVCRCVVAAGREAMPDGRGAECRRMEGAFYAAPDSAQRLEWMTYAARRHGGAMKSRREFAPWPHRGRYYDGCATRLCRRRGRARYRRLNWWRVSRRRYGGTASATHSD